MLKLNKSQQALDYLQQLLSQEEWLKLKKEVALQDDKTIVLSDLLLFALIAKLNVDFSDLQKEMNKLKEKNAKLETQLNEEEKNSPRNRPIPFGMYS